MLGIYVFATSFVVTILLSPRIQASKPSADCSSMLYATLYNARNIWFSFCTVYFLPQFHVSLL